MCCWTHIRMKRSGEPCHVNPSSRHSSRMRRVTWIVLLVMHQGAFSCHHLGSSCVQLMVATCCVHLSSSRSTSTPLHHAHALSSCVSLMACINALCSVKCVVLLDVWSRCRGPELPRVVHVDCVHVHPGDGMTQCTCVRHESRYAMLLHVDGWLTT